MHQIQNIFRYPLFRILFLLPPIILYLSLLLLAAIPKEISPVGLHKLSRSARYTLRRYGILPGMAVFAGRRKLSDDNLIERCLHIEGRDFNGETKSLPTGTTCPVKGTRFRTDIWSHMLLKWTMRAMNRPKSKAKIKHSVAKAFGFYFCRKAQDSIESVTIRVTDYLLNYSSNERTREEEVLGEYWCKSGNRVQYEDNKI